MTLKKISSQYDRNGNDIKTIQVLKTKTNPTALDSYKKTLDTHQHTTEKNYRNKPNFYIFNPVLNASAQRAIDALESVQNTIQDVASVEIQRRICVTV